MKVEFADDLDKKFGFPPLANKHFDRRLLPLDHEPKKFLEQVCSYYTLAHVCVMVHVLGINDMMIDIAAGHCIW